MVTVALQGDYRKPRPALVIQSDHFAETGTVSVLLLSGTLIHAPFIRVTVQPYPGNGLLKPSQVMVDKIMTLQQSKLNPPFGRLNGETMLAVTRSLAVFLAVA